MSKFRNSPIVMAIYLNARGFAFALFIGELAPLDWGVVEARGSGKREKILSRIERLFARCQPHVIVLQRNKPGSEYRKGLDEALALLAQQSGVPVVRISREDVRAQFAYLGCSTKDAIASAIAKHVPAFERFLPLPRKPWKSEDARMGLFDAAALALTFFHASGPVSEGR